MSRTKELLAAKLREAAKAVEELNRYRGLSSSHPYTPAELYAEASALATTSGSPETDLGFACDEAYCRAPATRVFMFRTMFMGERTFAHWCKGHARTLRSTPDRWIVPTEQDPGMPGWDVTVVPPRRLYRTDVDNPATGHLAAAERALDGVEEWEHG